MKHKLNYLKEKEKEVYCNARMCFIDGKEFFKRMKHEHMSFSIIPKYSKEV